MIFPRCFYTPLTIPVLLWESKDREWGIHRKGDTMWISMPHGSFVEYEPYMYRSLPLQVRNALDGIRIREEMEVDL